MWEGCIEGVKLPWCPLRQVFEHVRAAVKVSLDTSVLCRGYLDLRAAWLIPTPLLWGSAHAPWQLQEHPRGALCSSLAKCIARTFSQPQLQGTSLSFFYSVLMLTCSEEADPWEGEGKREDFNFPCCHPYLPSRRTRMQAPILSGNSCLRDQPAHPPTATSSFTYNKSKWEVTFFSHLY